MASGLKWNVGSEGRDGSANLVATFNREKKKKKRGTPLRKVSLNFLTRTKKKNEEEEKYEKRENPVNEESSVR